MRRLGVIGGSIIVLLAWSRAARAEPDSFDAEPVDYVELTTPRFGAKGQVVLTGAYGASVSSTQYKGGASFFSVNVQPGVDYFIIKNLSVGASAGAAFSDDQGTNLYGGVEDRSTSWFGGVRVGVNVPLSRRVSLYPRLTLGYESIVSSTTPAGFSTAPPLSTYQEGFTGEIYVPVLLHPRGHVFIGVGPEAFHSLAPIQVRGSGTAPSGGKATSLGGLLIIGGWFGGASALHPDDVPSPLEADNPPFGFGQRGDLTIGADFGLSGSYTTYENSDAWGGSIGVAPSADYFLFEHVSFGGALSVADARSRYSATTTGALVENTSTSFGMAGRVGYDMPLSSWLSWYVRAGFAFAESDLNSVTIGKGLAAHADAFAFVASAPLLFHITQHLFFGVGPNLSYDLASSVDPGGVSNPATTLGATALVGGWFHVGRQ